MNKMARRIRTVIVDDEPPSVDILKVMLSEYDEFDIVATCTDATEAVAEIKARQPDVAFLDIHMPGKSGFDILEELGPHHAVNVVFVTAYDEYAVKAFEKHAVDYLLKPVDYDRMKVTVDRIRAMMEERERIDPDEELMKFDHSRRAREYLQRVLLRKSGKIAILKITDVDIIQAEGDYLRFVVRDKAYLMREKMGDLEKALDPALFVRVHRSTIVNVTRIKEMERTFNMDHVITMADGRQVQMSRRYFDHVMKVLRSAPILPHQ